MAAGCNFMPPIEFVPMIKLERETFPGPDIKSIGPIGGHINRQRFSPKQIRLPTQCPVPDEYGRGPKLMIVI
jgi:hypothetical protein